MVYWAAASEQLQQEGKVSAEWKATPDLLRYPLFSYSPDRLNVYSHQSSQAPFTWKTLPGHLSGQGNLMAHVQQSLPLPVSSVSRHVAADPFPFPSQLHTASVARHSSITDSAGERSASSQPWHMLLPTSQVHMCNLWARGAVGSFLELDQLLNWPKATAVYLQV